MSSPAKPDPKSLYNIAYGLSTSSAAGSRPSSNRVSPNGSERPTDSAERGEGREEDSFPKSIVRKASSRSVGRPVLEIATRSGSLPRKEDDTRRPRHQFGPIATCSRVHVDGGARCVDVEVLSPCVVGDSPHLAGGNVSSDSIPFGTSCAAASSDGGASQWSEDFVFVIHENTHPMMNNPRAALSGESLCLSGSGAALAIGMVPITAVGDTEASNMAATPACVLPPSAAATPVTLEAGMRSSASDQKGNHHKDRCGASTSLSDAQMTEILQASLVGDESSTTDNFMRLGMLSSQRLNAVNCCEGSKTTPSASRGSRPPEAVAHAASSEATVAMEQSAAPKWASKASLHTAPCAALPISARPIDGGEDVSFEDGFVDNSGFAAGESDPQYVFGTSTSRGVGHSIIISGDLSD